MTDETNVVTADDGAKGGSITDGAKGGSAAPRSKGQLIAIVAAAIIAVIGIGLWIFQLSGGMVNTNMRNLSSWGVYLIFFMLFVGLSAGGLIISSVPKAFGLKGFGGISKIAIWVSIVSVVVAAAFIIVDLGSPWKVWELIAFAQFASPLFWDVIAISAYAVVSIAYLILTIKADKGQVNKTAMRCLSIIALATAVLVHSITAWIFGLLQGHEFWYTALLAPWFVSSALVSGLGLVLLIVAALHRAGCIMVEQGSFIRLVKLLGIFTVVDLYFFGCDMLTAGFPGAHDLGLDTVQMLATGVLAPFFWTEILLGVLVMIVAFVPKLRTMPLIVVAAAGAVLAIFCKRVQLLIGGFQIPNITYADVPSGPPLSDLGASLQGAFPALVYVPSLLEIGVTLGVLSLGVFLVLTGFRLLPLTSKQQ
jgi:molybdopterin-containing oxidoreductase family membrane subunit